MRSIPDSPATRESPLVLGGVLLGALAVALASALPYAGSWNDGSRLAAVESIVDYRSVTIDDSIFVRVPADRSPYPATETALRAHGTLDKLFINGHFYSDKPYLVSFLMGGVYQAARWLGVPAAAERPDLFCLLLTLCTSGLAYVIAVGCVYLLGRHVGLSLGWRLALTASFALSTVALPYVRHVNNHILLLAVMSALALHLAYLADDCRAGVTRWRRLALLGSLAGLGYCIDLGAGPVLLMCLLPLVAFRCRRFAPVAVFVAAALPWLLAHHAVNYSLGGVFKPMNAVAAYSDWPGSPFNAENLTGFLRHGPFKLAVYALALLFGKHGIVGHNLPLFLALPAFAVLLWKRCREWPELAFGLCWCGGTWLMYAAFSNNSGGACCSVRWFVPFLAPGYYGLAILLRRLPEYRGDFAVLSLWGGVLAAVMWWSGPWIQHMVPVYWPIVAAGLLSWLVWRIKQRRLVSRKPLASALPEDSRLDAA
jgi:hypothetical protein